MKKFCQHVVMGIVLLILCGCKKEGLSSVSELFGVRFGEECNASDENSMIAIRGMGKCVKINPPKSWSDFDDYYIVHSASGKQVYAIRASKKFKYEETAAVAKAKIIDRLCRENAPSMRVDNAMFNDGEKWMLGATELLYHRRLANGTVAPGQGVSVRTIYRFRKGYEVVLIACDYTSGIITPEHLRRATAEVVEP